MIFQTRPRQAAKKFCLVNLLVCSAACSNATSVIAPTFDRLVASADLIFTGQAVAQRSEWRNANGQRSIVTLVTFGVEAVHKGRAGSTTTLQFLGGTLGDVTLEVSEMPKFTLGERVVLFVEKNGENASPLVGFHHGKFSLQKDAGGRATVVKHDGRALAGVAELGGAQPAAAAARGGITHEEFTNQVRARVARGSGH